MRGFTARNTPYMGLVDRRPVVCRNLAMGFWVPLQNNQNDQNKDKDKNKGKKGGRKKGINDVEAEENTPSSTTDAP